MSKGEKGEQKKDPFNADTTILDMLTTIAITPKFNSPDAVIATPQQTGIKGTNE